MNNSAIIASTLSARMQNLANDGGNELRPALAAVDGRIVAPAAESTAPTSPFTASGHGPTVNASAPDFVVAFRNASAISPLLMANIPASERTPPPSTPPVQTPNPSTHSYRILLTDDAPTILKVCKRMLRTNGHMVQTAVNGHQSLEKLKTFYTNNDCDIMLTDLQMPVMDGIECTKRFRAWEEAQQCLLDAQGTPRRPRFLIVGMSANSDAQSKQEALDAGMDYFCAKPFNYQEFEAILTTYKTRFVPGTTAFDWDQSYH